ncbi:MAG: CRISPR-associated endonuclease Cas2 [Eubacterium sp.]|uniref:CRISPR-associated endoribonuclease Cas2 n=1 Tax=Candidatus Weimeria bifida TaxID=2599074 RepID=A0A6N7IYH7_9FIRM|nr:CRISPR-associated endonuclease Cas2 [Eubacterium sp.]MQN00822.1 CRISPR-associated endonuclease Cas2 [Candidatus Weimeria bifida]RRF94307.1 MAG: CRISPR-associated endonuclease Cas2 [Lachnospiraceae bacterium]
MLYLLTYDIDTESDKGRRLQKVAKICESYGQRVQNSVFELNLDPTKMTELKIKLDEMIDPDIDSVRIYKLGKYMKYDVYVLGKKETVELSEPGEYEFFSVKTDLS